MIFLADGRGAGANALTEAEAAEAVEDATASDKVTEKHSSELAVAVVGLGRRLRFLRSSMLVEVVLLVVEAVVIAAAFLVGQSIIRKEC